MRDIWNLMTSSSLGILASGRLILRLFHTEKRGAENAYSFGLAYTYVAYSMNRDAGRQR